ncbi:MAG: response regulator receiver protein [Magnetococcales bacterium]|nr:response regulator receiver protein [Magnetococcales bacterium]HIJ82873.1 SpoIIE family protein phosphatase [Magnetococcales bacterium]
MDKNTTDSPIILVADDDIFNLELTAVRLKQAGYAVVSAENGIDALRLFHHSPPALVLLDASMPEMDGYSVCREIKSLPHGRNVPIVMVTAANDTPSVHRAFDAGAEEFVSKPVKWAVLHRRIRLLLEHQRRNQILNHRNQQIHFFMNKTPVAVAMFDNRMRYLHASDRWLEDHNLANVEISGRTHHELLPNEAEHWQKIDERCVKGFWERNDADPVQQKDGSLRWYRWEAFPWKKDDGLIEGIILFKEDITRQQETENELKAYHDRLAVEREFIEEIINRMRNSSECNFNHLRSIQSPMEKTTGDILLSAFRPNGTQHIVLGDFTGHGLSAALGGPMVSDIFYTMTRKNIPLRDILNETNVQLHRKTPTSMFMAAGFVEISPERNKVRLWNCSIPDMLIFDKNTSIRRIQSRYFARGMLAKPDDDSGVEMDCTPGDRIYLYTDGFVEQRDADGTMFGQDHLEQLLEQMIRHREPLEMVQRAVLGFRSGVSQNDDMTMVEITC